MSNLASPNNKLNVNFKAMCKGTKIISELSGFFKENNNSDAISCIMSVMETINLSDKQTGLSIMYNCKMNSWQVVMLLLVFPFFAIKNAASSL